MGLLFNTPDTLEWVSIGHQRFRAAWTRFQTESSVWAPRFRACGAHAPSLVIMCSEPLALVHPRLHGRWLAWLALLDAAGASPIVGGHIADAIANVARKFSGVEFHFVPDR